MDTAAALRQGIDIELHDFVTWIEPSDDLASTRVFLDASEDHVRSYVIEMEIHRQRRSAPQKAQGEARLRAKLIAPARERARRNAREAARQGEHAWVIS